MKGIFLDTDVIIDFITDRKPFSEDSAAVFSMIEQKRIRGYASSLSFSNICFMLKKYSSHRQVISVLTELTGFMHILKVDGAMVRSALNANFRDFEDAIQYHCALGSKRVSSIITRNTRDYSASGLSVMTPGTFLKSFREWT
jgi:predicted nucleic acid-binding protein